MSDVVVTAKLIGKPGILAVAFAAACARRLLNTCLLLHDYDDARLIAQKAFDAIVEYISDGIRVPSQLMVQLEQLIPDEDDDPSIEGGIVDDTLAALYFTISAISGTVTDAENAATRALDTAFRIDSSRIPGASIEVSEVLEHGALFRLETDRQQRDILDLEANPNGNSAALFVIARSINERIVESLES